MDDSTYLRILFKDSFRGIEITEINFFESGTNTSDFFYSVNYIFTRIGKVVNDDYIVACVLQLYCGMGTNESRSTCYKNCLFHICFNVFFSLAVAKVGVFPIRTKYFSTFFPQMHVFGPISYHLRLKTGQKACKS